MRTLVESLKRLYESGKVSKEKISGMVKGKTITKEEFCYVTGEKYDG